MLASVNEIKKKKKKKTHGQAQRAHPLAGSASPLTEFNGEGRESAGKRIHPS
jgi:hypothetical protein